MRPGHFIAATLTASLVVIAFNFLVDYFAPNLPAQQLLRRIKDNAPLARTIFLGDSQMAADADPAAFSRACSYASPALNGALGATYASEHCLILEYLLPYAHSADTVIYGFFDSRTTDPVPAGWHQLGGNRALAYLFPARASTLLASDEGEKLWSVRLIAYLPMVRERNAIWVKIERIRRRCNRFGLPAEMANRFGRAKDFTAFEPSDSQTFEARLRSAVAKRQPLNRPLREIVRSCSANHLKFYLVEMPVPSLHRQRFYATENWQVYREDVRHLIAGNQGQLIDASDWVTDEGFEDPLHLNSAGAATFSARLAGDICGASPRLR